MTPVLVTSFAAPNIAEQLYSRYGWRAASGVCTVVLSAACLPLITALFRAQPRRSGTDEASGSTTTGQNPSRRERRGGFAVELDLLGAILAAAGFCLLLLPSLHMPATLDGWQTSTVIGMMIWGFFFLTGFALWEYWLAPAPCVPLSLMKDMNVLGGCLAGMFAVASVACWTSYYSSYLQVVHGQTAASAGYITNIHMLSYALIAPMLGL